MLPKAPAPKAILEAALYVDDLDAAEEFYGGLLGLERIQRADNRHVFFRCGNSVLLLFSASETAKAAGNPRLPVPPHGAHGPGHVCLAQPREDMQEMRDRLRAAGVDIEAEFDWPHGPRSVYFRDPAGNSVEIAEPHLWSY
ncbi:VOC family protein [Leisingera sp. ANG-M7]|uniref:VOC family protein n=1 Tax=Leisingera sp. ANG-M7 TaxID=1577902 RepID=UPI00057F2717|nr:VOC family protein [Leisingera sp. ANG-M7]KIC37484.1 bleomycin resistance protein [Leisingera sp. ANG-M7]